MGLFDWPDTQLPAAKRGSELRGSKILVYIGASVQTIPFRETAWLGGRREESEKKADSTICPITVLSPWSATLVAMGVGRRVSGAMPTDFAL